MQEKEFVCNGRSSCKNCTAIGECPLDHQHCDYCGEPLEDGSGIEIESEYGIITVCPDCYTLNLLGFKEFIEEEF